MSLIRCSQCGDLVDSDAEPECFVGDDAFCIDCRPEEDEDTEPCTEAARDQGCTCRMSHTHSASVDPPHEIVDPWCPLHGGRDPDRERDERMDREAEDWR